MPGMRTSEPLKILAAFGLIALACDAPTAVTVPEDHVAEGEEDVASTPFYGGVFLGDAATTPGGIRDAIGRYTERSGKAPALVKSFHRLDADLSAGGWAGQILREVARVGSTNYVALDLGWDGSGRTGLLERLNRGEADALIASAARSFASIGAPVLVEPGWEMNGDWGYGWQGVANGGAAGPAAFVDAWRRVVDIFRAAGATNVQWVFNPNTGNPVGGRAPGSGHWNWYGHYYPGGDYVDYIGAHGFNGPSAYGTPDHDFDALFYGPDADHIVPDMLSRFPDKPIIIGEFATEANGAKADWIKDAYRRMLRDERVVGAIWFDMDKEADWRIDSSPAAAEAYRAAMASARVQSEYRAGPAPAAAVLAAR